MKRSTIAGTQNLRILFTLTCLTVGVCVLPTNAFAWQLPAGPQLAGPFAGPQPGSVPFAAPPVPVIENGDGPSYVYAQDGASPSDELPMRMPPVEGGAATPPQNIDAIMKRLEQLEKEVAANKKSEKKADDKKKDDALKVPEPIDLSKEKWTVKTGGHVQMDYINWANADPAIPDAQNYFEFRRLRLTADGTGYGVYDFRLQMTLEPETVGETQPLGTVTSPDVKDAYFSINEIPWLGRFRIGNFFVPFGLEQVTNDTNNVFLERSIPTQGVFTADREVGMAFYNCSENQDFTWTTGMFFDSISESLKERIDNNQGYRLSGRVTWLPYYDEPSNGRYLMHVGAGVLYTSDQNDQVRFRARPQIHEGPRIIDSGNLDASTITTGNLEWALVMGPVTFQAEGYISQPNMLNTSSPIVNGCYFHGSYFLTGENRMYQKFGQHGAQFGRNEPFQNFFMVPGAISWGAVELKSRWSHLDLNQLGSGQYNDITVGFNWYWSDRTRWMFDWIHPYTSADAVFGQTSSDIIAMRFDFNW